MGASTRACGGKQGRTRTVPPTVLAVIYFVAITIVSTTNPPSTVAATATAAAAAAARMTQVGPLVCGWVPNRKGNNNNNNNGVSRRRTGVAVGRHGVRQTLTSSRRPTAAISSDQTSGGSRLALSNNLWSIDECLEQWNRSQQQQQQQQQQQIDDGETTIVTTSIQFVDATWFHKGERNGRNEYEEGPRLPGAFHWDTGDMATSGELFPETNPLNLKNVFPPEWMVGEALEKMGVASSPPPTTSISTTSISTSTTLVVYGRKGTLFAPRVWYLLKKYYRCGPVKLLQGSLEEWIARGGPVDETTIRNSTIKARDLMDRRQNEEESGHPLVSPSARNRLVDKSFVEEVLEQRRQREKQTQCRAVKEEEEDSSSLVVSGAIGGARSGNNALPVMIIDTRGSSFAKNGHIPGALHLPYASLSLTEDPLTLKPGEKLEETMRQFLGEDTVEKLRSEPALLTCGTGVSVCTLALVLDELGFPEPWIYDGSWDEWGRDPFTPKEGGEGRNTD